jgi:3D (Asp-Asp-Asp) domain-containing protein
VLEACEILESEIDTGDTGVRKIQKIRASLVAEEQVAVPEPKRWLRPWAPLLAGLLVTCVASTGQRSLEVTATAYNSVARQTSGQPNLTAWGDRFEPGTQAIAVSRDLIELGLTHGVEVEIEGLPGKYVVRDKMAKRWSRRIDIYMGDDVQRALRWGWRKVTIHWPGD